MSVISEAAEELIIEQEVSSEAVYKKRYTRPTWPGGASGVTIGIGYDLGMSTIDQIKKAWGNLVSPDMLQAMTQCAGMTGEAGRTALAHVRYKINIPWDVAMHVFENVDMPRWVNIVKSKLPNCDELNEDCMGALVSLAYNRGPSFDKDGDRYREMRAIKQHMRDKTFSLIPNELRSMARLWQGSSVRGLVTRRNAEADLFEQGLSKMKPVPVVTYTGNADQSDEPDTTDDTPDVVNAKTAPQVSHDLPYSSSIMIRVVKQELDALGYHEFGEMDGNWGGRSVAAVAAFKLDRHVTGPAVIDDQLMEEIDKAKKEGWTRPMADFRKDATASDLAAKGNVVVKAAGQNKLLAWLLGVPSMIGAMFQGVGGKAHDAVDYLTPIKDFFGDLPVSYLCFGLLAVAGVLWLNSNKAQKAQVEDYQKGKLL